MAAEDGGVPAGWYPDPLGLRQLRWWDGAAWTEFTAPTEAELDGDGGDAGDEAVHILDLDEDDDEDVEDTLVVPREESFAEQLAEPNSAPAAGAESVWEPAAVVEPEPALVREREPESVPEPAREFVEESAPESESEPEAVPESEFVPVAALEPEPEPEPESGSESTLAPVPVVEPAPEPEPTGALAVVPEPFDPVTADPFAAAEARAVAFTSRRARRAYERKLELEERGAGMATPPYADLDTNPVDIPLTSPSATEAPVSAEQSDELPAATPFVPPAAPPTAPVAEAPVADTTLDDRDDRDDRSARSAPASPDSADAAFSLEATGVADELPPARTLIPKRTVGVIAYVLALLPPLALLAIVLLRYVPGLTVTPIIAAGVGGAALVIGLLLALLDANALRRWGHERTASPLWALLTPIVYLTMRSVATRRETGKDGSVVLAWILGLVLAVAVVGLFPDLVALLVPGVTAPWSSPLG